MGNEKSMQRNSAADILRCLAFVFVPSVHFLLNSGFYQATVESTRTLIMVIARALFIICVPLFMTLSGYLMRTKQLSASYYKKLGKTYFSYVLASIACVVFAVLKLEQEWTLRSTLIGILEFKAAPYSWYIEMYMGLFLFVPFLNLLYNNIPSRKWKRNLLIIGVCLVFLPSVVNVYNFDSADWWYLPSSNTDYVEILPNWWVTVLYPVVYYFLGCYLSEYKIRLNKWINLFLILYVTFVYGVYTYWRSFQVKFIWGVWCQYYSLFTFILTLLVFLFFLNLRYDKMPAVIGNGFAKISGLCMNAYLLSWIFDKLFYPLLKDHVGEIEDRFVYFFAVVPIVIVLSLLLSYVLQVLQTLLTDFAVKIIGFIKKKSKKPLATANKT
ncbi:MAG: acyltransferase family protein [Clostridia bacterium]|nr:acyltransferase family protein [Clostridia bacterium]